MTNPVQPLDPISAPDPVTPADSPSSPSDYASVTPHGQGPAPYDIQAGSDEAAVTSAFNAANVANGQGVLYPQSERQSQTRQLMDSPMGFGLGGFDVDAGTDCGWPNNIEPGG